MAEAGPDRRPLLIALVTHERRTAEAERTLAGLARVGVVPRAYVGVGPPSPQANRANFERPLADAAEATAGLLLFEDDVDLSADFPAALTAALTLDTAVTFWLCKPHNHPPGWCAALRGKSLSPRTGFYPVAKRNTWFGTQALLLPAAEVAQLVADPAFGTPNHQSFDRWYRDRCRGLLAALPNPVQHRSPTTLVDPNRPPRISPTFHMPRDPADWRLACRTTAAT